MQPQAVKKIKDAGMHMKIGIANDGDFINQGWYLPPAVADLQWEKFDQIIESRRAVTYEVMTQKDLEL